MSSAPPAPAGSSNEVQLLIQLVSDSNAAAAAGSAVLHRLLAHTPAMADDLVQHVPALLRHAALSRAGPAQMFAASVLLRLLDHPSAASAVARADIQPLLAALQSSPADDDNATAQLAATLLSSLATTHEGALALAPRVPQLLAAAAAHHQQGHGDDRSATVSALLQAVTCAGQTQLQALSPAVEAAGELLQMLDCPDTEQQEATAKLLNMLLLLPDGAAALAQDCHISGLLELLQRRLQRQQQQPQAAEDDALATAQQQDEQQISQAAMMNLYAAQVLAAVAARPAGAAALAQRRRVAALMRCLQVPCNRLGRLVLSALAHVTAAAAAAPGGLASPQLLLKPEHVQQLVDAAGRDGLTLLALQTLVPLGTSGSYVQLLAAQLGRLQRAVDDMQQQEQQQQEEQEEGDDGEEADGQAEQQQQAADAVSQARLLLQAIASRVAAFQAVMQQNQGPAVREMQHAVVAFASGYASSMQSHSQASASMRRSCSSPPGGHGCQQHQELLQQAARLAEACNRHFSVAAGLEAAAAGARQPDGQPGGDVD